MTNLSPLMTATSSALGWLLWSLLVGSLANRLPAAWFEREHWFMRRPWSESRQGFENRLAIRSWKPWLPDAGNAQPKGIAKASLVGRESIKLERLVLETRRAELVHLALWLPPPGVLIKASSANTSSAKSIGAHTK